MSKSKSKSKNKAKAQAKAEKKEHNEKLSGIVQRFRDHVNGRIEDLSKYINVFQKQLDPYIHLMTFDLTELSKALKKANNGDTIEIIESKIKYRSLQIRSMKQSRKFWTYIYNLDLENCKKCHKEIAELDLEYIEIITDCERKSTTSKPMNCYCFDDSGEIRGTKKNGKAYQDICEKVKIDNDTREEKIEYVKYLISVR